MTLQPLRVSFEVAADQEHAFRAWTERIDAWWPASHSASGDPDRRVVLEPGVGGRIYERTPDGTEHEWGVVTRWEPFAVLAYRWHLRCTPEEATDIRIDFVPVDKRTTRVEIEQTSWERLGAEAQVWRDRNRAGWAGVLPHYRDHLEDTR
jgi:hypothetical protein